MGAASPTEVHAHLRPAGRDHGLEILPPVHVAQPPLDAPRDAVRQFHARAQRRIDLDVHGCRRDVLREELDSGIEHAEGQDCHDERPAGAQQHEGPMVQRPAELPLVELDDPRQAGAHEPVADRMQHIVVHAVRGTDGRQEQHRRQRIDGEEDEHDEGARPDGHPLGECRQGE